MIVVISFDQALDSNDLIKKLYILITFVAYIL